MDSYQLICINLKRRSDRKDTMTEIFSKQNITNYTFFEAIDGTLIDPYDQSLNLFKHYKHFVRKQGIVGVALSHYNIWKKLVSDESCQYYVILEDDVTLEPNFETNVKKILSQIKTGMCLVFLGYSMTNDARTANKHVFIDDKSYTVHPYNGQIYKGGAFGYIISKFYAAHLLNYVNQNGIKFEIDILITKSGLPLFESHPQLVFTDSVQFTGNHVDSDIQYNNNIFSYKIIPNIYSFTDYVFYPNKDSLCGDIKEVCADIPMLKNLCDSMENCVAFNTYGWLKHTIVEPKDFAKLQNLYYSCDGIYVKKSYIDRMSLKKKTMHTSAIEEKFYNQKIQRLHDKIKKTPIRIYISEMAQLYSTPIIKMITNNFSKFIFVSHDYDYDMSIINYCDDPDVKLDYHPRAINIMISSEPYEIKHHLDICIDTKYNAVPNILHNIYYPFTIASIGEYRKSIDPSYHFKNKTKFCAYMYFIFYNHRVRYFNLVSSYKKVDALGKCCSKNIDNSNDRFSYDPDKTYLDIAVERYSEYKFVMAIENTFAKGYSTEKLISPLIAGSLPIYWGDSEIFRYINKKRVIYVNDFKTDGELLEYIKFLDTNDEAYNVIINEPIFASPELSFDSIEKEITLEIRQKLGFR